MLTKIKSRQLTSHLLKLGAINGHLVTAKVFVSADEAVGNIFQRSFLEVHGVVRERPS